MGIHWNVIFSKLRLGRVFPQRPEDSLHRLFFDFLGGWRGFALLVLRNAAGAMLVFPALLCLTEPAASVGLRAGSGAAMLTAGLLVIGYLTPIAALAAAAGGVVAYRFNLLSLCAPALADTKVSFALAIPILLAIVLIGPGRFSVDARLFGRREILIPRTRNNTNG